MQQTLAGRAPEVAGAARSSPAMRSVPTRRAVGAVAVLCTLALATAGISSLPRGTGDGGDMRDARRALAEHPGAGAVASVQWSRSPRTIRSGQTAVRRIYSRRATCWTVMPACQQSSQGSGWSCEVSTELRVIHLHATTASSARPAHPTPRCSTTWPCRDRHSRGPTSSF